MAAITQVRYRHSEGRAYYDRKVAEGKTHKEALRALMRRISDALFAAMVADAKRDREQGRRAKSGPRGQGGNGSVACAAGSHPQAPALRPSHSRASSKVTPRRRAAHALVLPGEAEKSAPRLLTYKEDSFGRPTSSLEVSNRSTTSSTNQARCAFGSHSRTSGGIRNSWSRSTGL